MMKHQVAAHGKTTNPGSTRYSACIENSQTKEELKLGSLNYDVETSKVLAGTKHSSILKSEPENKMLESGSDSESQSGFGFEWMKSERSPSMDDNGVRLMKTETFSDGSSDCNTQESGEDESEGVSFAMTDFGDCKIELNQTDYY